MGADNKRLQEELERIIFEHAKPAMTAPEARALAEEIAAKCNAGSVRRRAAQPGAPAPTFRTEDLFVEPGRNADQARQDLLTVMVMICTCKARYARARGEAPDDFDFGQVCRAALRAAQKAAEPRSIVAGIARQIALLGPDMRLSVLRDWTRMRPVSDEIDRRRRARRA